MPVSEGDVLREVLPRDGSASTHTHAHSDRERLVSPLTKVRVCDVRGVSLTHRSGRVMTSDESSTFKVLLFSSPLRLLCWVDIMNSSLQGSVHLY